MQATGNVLIVNPRRRRSLLPRKVAVKANDDLAEKRLRRRVLEQERRKEEERRQEQQERRNQEIPVVPTPAEAAKAREIAVGVEKALEEIEDAYMKSRNNGKVFRSRLLGISLASEDDEVLSAEDQQIASNWELAVKFALEKAGELDRQQWLREWREQEEEERRWEANERRWWANREYADYSPHDGTEYWVAIPKSLQLCDATIRVREGWGHYNRVVPGDLFRGEPSIEMSYPIPSKVFSSLTYDYGCPFRSCSYGEHYEEQPSTDQTFGAAAIEQRHWVNAERIEAAWAELGHGWTPNRKELGPGRRQDSLLLATSTSWQGRTIVGGPPPVAKTRLNVQTGSTNNIEGRFGRLEEIDEDYMPGLKSVDSSDDDESESDDDESESDDEEDQWTFVPLRAKL